MDSKPKAAGAAPAGKNARAERLARALRANLKRRKLQARVRSAEAKASPGRGESAGD